MSEHKLIAVFGATGAQGGGLAHAILNDPQSEFTVRAITRNANSDKAKELKNLGAEVVEADLDHAESLKRAFQGAYGAFCVTFFWEHMSPEKETQHVKNMASAAKEAAVKHVIWSTFEDTRDWVPLENDSMPTLMNKYKVPHFDAKAEANAYFTEHGVPVTFLKTSFYWDNLINMGMGPQKDDNGNLIFTLPMGDKKLPGIAASDIGKCAYGIFKEGDKYIGKSVGIAGEHLTGSQMVKALSDALGKNVQYNAIAPDVYRSLGFPGADDLGNMFQFKHDFEKDYCAARNLETSRSLNPSMQTFGKWLSKNKDRIPMG
jgi:uncharacterized protein YbjT (DUF2867 family)